MIMWRMNTSIDNDIVLSYKLGAEIINNVDALGIGKFMRKAQVYSLANRAFAFIEPFALNSFFLLHSKDFGDSKGLHWYEKEQRFFYI